MDKNYFENWWEKIGTWDNEDKNLSKWWHKHASSMSKPLLTSSIVLKDHKFWDIVLPIIDNPQQFLDFDVLSLQNFGEAWAE